MSEIVKGWSSRSSAELCHSSVTCWPSAGAEFEVLCSAGADSLANALAVVSGDGLAMPYINQIRRLHARILVFRIQAGVNARTFRTDSKYSIRDMPISTNDYIFI